MNATEHKCTFRRNIEQSQIDDMLAKLITAMTKEGKFKDAIQDKIGATVDTTDLEKQLSVLNASLHQAEIIKTRLEQQMDNLDVTDTHYDKKISDLQRRLDAQYDRIDEVEETMAELKSQIYELKKNQIDADSIYGFLGAFNEVYSECTDAVPIIKKRGADAMPGILVVEDDENLNRGITFSLKKSGYEVFSAESVKKAKRIASDNNVDVTICDVNLPDGNGLEFVRWMRCNYNTYIICLTALDQEMDQVMGYEAGADDYITKPFSLSVLLLKIEAHFRRRQEKTEAGKMISGDIVFIAGKMKVLIKSREISLTKTELKMLTFFLQNPKQILSKTQILENVFDLEGDFVDENTIAVNIRRLREKIEDNPAAPVYIKNIRGLGYIWNQEVRQ